MVDKINKKYELAIRYFSKVMHCKEENELDNDFMKEHAHELIYCHENKKDLLDFDFWVQYEKLLDEKLTFSEYVAIDMKFDGSPLDLDSNDIQEIQKFKTNLNNYRKWKMIADELIYHGQSNTMSSNRIWEASDLIDEYNINKNDIEIIAELMMNDDENVLDIDFNQVNKDGTIDVIFNYTRCPIVEDDLDWEGNITELQEEWRKVQDEYAFVKHKYQYIYAEGTNTVIFKSIAIENIENVYSEIQAKKLVNDMIYKEIDQRLQLSLDEKITSIQKEKIDHNHYENTIKSVDTLEK